MKKINLGCGSQILDGYENYDKFPIDGRVKYIDLDTLPLPFDDKSVDEVIIFHVLEHLDVNLLDFMKDINRILKPDGVLYVRLPTWSNKLQHNRFFHSKGYLNELTNGAGKNGKYFKPHFETVYVKGRNFNPIRLMLFRVIGMIRDMSFTEYEWKFVKK